MSRRIRLCYPLTHTPYDILTEYGICETAELSRSFRSDEYVFSTTFFYIVDSNTIASMADAPGEKLSKKYDKLPLFLIFLHFNVICDCFLLENI